MKRRFTFLTYILLLIACTGYAQGENFILNVTAPASIAGPYDLSSSANFGSEDCASIISGEVVLANAGTDTEACDNARSIGLNVEGKIALVDRGSCNFLEKAEVVQDFGAIAIIVCNNVGGDTLITMGADLADAAILARANAITIPTFFMRMSDCNTLKTEIGNGVMVDTENLNLGFVDANADDEVLYTETFTGGLNGWTTEGLFCGAGVDASLAQWEWRGDGTIGPGEWADPEQEIVSTSACDGFVVFNSDFLDSGGVSEGEGECPTFHEGVITSPVIDLSATNAGDLIGIKFAQAVRHFDSEYFIDWSVDGGETWNPVPVNTNVAVNAADFSLQRIPLTGVTNQDQLQIRFRFARNYYFWAIDDVQLINFVGVNAKIDDTFYTPLSFAVPVTHADADTFLFATDVINNGAVAIDIRFSVDITNNETDEVVHSDQVELEGIQPQDTAFVAIQDADGSPRLWVPNEIPPGLYRMDYNIEVLGQEESNLDDNSTTFFFAITENAFAKALGSDLTAFRYAGAEDQWGIGSYFQTAVGVGRFAAEAIQFGAFTTEGNIENFIAEVALLKQVGVANSYFPDGFENETNTYLGHPNFEVVFQQTHVFTDNTSGLEFVSIDLTNEGIDLLEPGTGYVVMIFFDDNETSTVGAPNKDLALIADNDTEMSGAYLFLPDRNPSWYTGFSGFTPPAPDVLLGISLTSPVDEVPLAESTLKAYPNPANNILSAEVNLEKASDASLIVASIDGKIINVQNMNNVTSDTYSVDVSGLTNGTYLLRLSTNEGTRTIPIVVQH